MGIIGAEGTVGGRWERADGDEKLLMAKFFIRAVSKGIQDKSDP